MKYKENEVPRDLSSFGGLVSGFLTICTISRLVIHNNYKSSFKSKLSSVKLSKLKSNKRTERTFQKQACSFNLAHKDLRHSRFFIIKPYYGFERKLFILNSEEILWEKIYSRQTMNSFDFVIHWLLSREINGL